METSKRNAASKLETVLLPYRSITGRFARGTKTALTNGLYRTSSDPLQSSSVILDEDGDMISRTTYIAFGEERVTCGVESPTDYGYTGQRSYVNSFGLQYYVARWYDPVTAHFAQADTIISNPGTSGDWNRYAAYVRIITDYYINEYAKGTYGTVGYSNPDHVIADFWDKENVKASPQLVEYILDWEKFKSQPYQDSEGNWTVG